MKKTNKQPNGLEFIGLITLLFLGFMLAFGACSLVEDILSLKDKVARLEVRESDHREFNNRYCK